MWKNKEFDTVTSHVIKASSSLLAGWKVALHFINLRNAICGRQVWILEQRGGERSSQTCCFVAIYYWAVIWINRERERRKKSQIVMDLFRVTYFLSINLWNKSKVKHRSRKTKSFFLQQWWLLVETGELSENNRYISVPQALGGNNMWGKSGSFFLAMC